MKSVVALVGVMLCLAVTSALGEEKSFTDGQVTELTYIKVKPGRFEDDMKYLDTTYKAIMEATKKAGLITGYAVYSAEPRTPQEPDLILAVVYANMAALDKSDEQQAIAEKVAGTMAAQGKAAIEREEVRQVLGSETIRELVLK
jgi:hypothetical protein